MKSCLARFGVRTSRQRYAKRRNISKCCKTPEGVPLPPNTLLELRRDMARLRFITDQIRELRRRVRNGWNRRLKKNRMRWSDCSPALLALVSKTANMLVHEILSRSLRGSTSRGALQHAGNRRGRLLRPGRFQRRPGVRHEGPRLPRQSYTSSARASTAVSSTRRTGESCTCRCRLVWFLTTTRLHSILIRKCKAPSERSSNSSNERAARTS
jgi:hypothetical protein